MKRGKRATILHAGEDVTALRVMFSSLFTPGPSWSLLGQGQRNGGGLRPLFWPFFLPPFFSLPRFYLSASKLAVRDWGRMKSGRNVETQKKGSGFAEQRKHILMICCIFWTAQFFFFRWILYEQAWSYFCFLTAGTVSTIFESAFIWEQILVTHGIRCFT